MFSSGAFSGSDEIQKASAGDRGAFLDRLKAGDQNAFSELVEEKSGMVFNLAIRMVRDRELAEELERLLSGQSPLPTPPGLNDRVMAAVALAERERVETQVIEIIKGREKLALGKDVLPYLALALFTSIIFFVLWSPITGIFSLFPRNIPWEELKVLLTLSGNGIIIDLNLVFLFLSLLFSLYLALGRPVPTLTRLRDSLPF